MFYKPNYTRTIWEKSADSHPNLLDWYIEVTAVIFTFDKHPNDSYVYRYLNAAVLSIWIYPTWVAKHISWHLEPTTTFFWLWTALLAITILILLFIFVLNWVKSRIIKSNSKMTNKTKRLPRSGMEGKWGIIQVCVLSVLRNKKYYF